MPAKNILKEFASESYYHVYNRGVAKQNIFLDEQDYKVFLSYLKIYLSLPDLQGRTLKVPPSHKLKNFYEQIRLLAYCLLPNHFHLFLWQKEIDSMTGFMRAVCTKYSMYFNRKYKRVGPVFQGRYKAVWVNSEIQFIYLSKYIHRNPLPLTSGTDLEGYKYSSYPVYLGRFNQDWVDKGEILYYFSKLKTADSYRRFVEETDERDLTLIKKQLIDFEF